MGLPGLPRCLIDWENSSSWTSGKAGAAGGARGTLETAAPTSVNLDDGGPAALSWRRGLGRGRRGWALFGSARLRLGMVIEHP